MSKSLRATLAGLAGYSIYGLSFLFSKVALGISSPYVLLSVRFTLAFLVLSLFLIPKKNRISFKGKPVGKLLLMGFIQPVVYFICESYGIAMTTASFSGVIIGLVPVAGIIFGTFFLKEKCGVLQIICTLLSVIGVALTTTGGSGGFSLPGLILLLVSVFSTTAFSIISRNISDEFTPFERTYAMTALGSICFTVTAVISTKGDPSQWITPLTDSSFVLSTLYLAVVSSVAAFTLVNYALNHLSVGHTLIFSNFTSVISVIAGIAFLGDSFNLIQLSGIVLIILSVFAVSVYRLKKDTAI